MIWYSCEIFYGYMKVDCNLESIESSRSLLMGIGWLCCGWWSVWRKAEERDLGILHGCNVRYLPVLPLFIFHVFLAERNDSIDIFCVWKYGCVCKYMSLNN